MKKYEDQERVSKHYKVILCAKSTIPRPQKSRSVSKKTTISMQDYQWRKKNEKIVEKLRQIYDKKPKKICLIDRKSTNRTVDSEAKQKQKTMEVGSLVSEFRKKQYKSIINQQNVKMLNRIMAIKPTITNFKEREKQLSDYSRLVRKSSFQKEQKQLYSEFRQTLLRDSQKATSSRKKRRYKKRKSSLPLQTPAQTDASHKQNSYYNEEITGEEEKKIQIL